MATHMEGILLKKSYISYRPRFFVLEGDTLLYKASKEDAKERSSMVLTTDSQVVEFKAKRGKGLRCMEAWKKEIQPTYPPTYS